MTYDKALQSVTIPPKLFSAKETVEQYHAVLNLGPGCLGACPSPDSCLREVATGGERQLF